MSCDIETQAGEARAKQQGKLNEVLERRASQIDSDLRGVLGFETYGCLGKVWHEQHYVCFSVRMRGLFGLFGAKRTLAVWRAAFNPFTGREEHFVVGGKEWAGIDSLAYDFATPEEFLVAVDKLR